MLLVLVYTVRMYISWLTLLFKVLYENIEKYSTLLHVITITLLLVITLKRNKYRFNSQYLEILFIPQWISKKEITIISLEKSPRGLPEYFVIFEYYVILPWRKFKNFNFMMAKLLKIRICSKYILSNLRLIAN